VSTPSPFFCGSLGSVENGPTIALESTTSRVCTMLGSLAGLTPSLTSPDNSCLPRHGPQKENYRDIHRGTTISDRRSSQLRILRDPDELLELATYEAGCEARSAAYRKEEMEQEISRKMRERILPD
jgi:hypothetical protein